MGKYNSLNDVVSGHITALIEANSLDPADYPYQNDINSALMQLAKIYATIGGVTAAVAKDEFSIAGALDVLLDVVDTIVANA